MIEARGGCEAEVDHASPYGDYIHFIVSYLVLWKSCRHTTANISGRERRGSAQSEGKCTQILSPLSVVCCSN